MKEEKIRVGDVVKLVSGSPSMTVCRLRSGMDSGGQDTYEAKCIWFNQAIVGREWFPIEVLKKIG